MSEGHTEASREDKKCKMEGCKRPYRAKSLCNVCYTASGGTHELPSWPLQDLHQSGRLQQYAPRVAAAASGKPVRVEHRAAPPPAAT